MEKITALTNFFFRHSKKILWLAIIIYIIVIFGLLSFKYHSFGYNAIDLGIYNQVFFNSAQGQLFELSLHPHLYLGDHFELFIILLLPFYMILQSPLMLLFLQTAFIALSAWPLYLIARQKLGKPLSLLICLAFLLNPFILNANFFEFHILPFAIFLLLFAFYFYLRDKYIAYLIFIFLSLTIREDVAFVVIMLGILALIDRKKIHWIIVPIILGAGWFAAAYQLTGYFNESGGYKFISLYGWLGDTPGQVIKNFFLQPWLVIKQIFSLNNLFLLIGLTIPLAGLPWLKIKYLLPALLVLGQLILFRVSSTIVLQTHYSILIIPFLFIAAVFALHDLQNRKETSRSIKTFISKQKPLLITILIVAIIYSFFTFSPVLGSVKNLFQHDNQSIFVAEKNKTNQLIESSDAVLASYEFLPALSSREYFYSLHYTFLGKQQFSDKDFIIPENINKLVINFNDFIIYYLQSQNISVYQRQYSSGASRINELINQNNLCLEKIIDDIALYNQDCSSDIKLVREIENLDNDTKQYDTSPTSPIKLLGWIRVETDSENTIPISFYWQNNIQLDNDYQLNLIIKDELGKTVYQKMYPLGYGLYPTSQWPLNKIIETNYWFLIPQPYSLQNHHLYFQVVTIKGYMGLNSLRSAAPVITKKENAGDPFLVDYNTL